MKLTNKQKKKSEKSNPNNFGFSDLLARLLNLGNFLSDKEMQELKKHKATIDKAIENLEKFSEKNEWDAENKKFVSRKKK